MDPFLPKYKLVLNEMGKLFCLLVSLRVLALSLKWPLNSFSNLKATLRLDGSSAMRLTIACNPDQGIEGLVLLPGTSEPNTKGSVMMEEVSKPHTNCK